MSPDFKYPRIDALDSVLIKIGVDPKSRYDSSDQDHEYTTCRVEEIDDYIQLYEKSGTTDYEKRVLGCYLLECLNEYLDSSGKAHAQQNKVFGVLHKDLHIHESELEYWSDMSDPNREHCWSIAPYLTSWHGN